MAASLVEQARKSKNGKVTKYALLFTDGNPVAGISSQAVLSGVNGLLIAARAKFGSPAPNSLAITISDDDGITIASGTLTASGIITITSPPQYLHNGASITLSGNTTASAIANIILYILQV